MPPLGDVASRLPSSDSTFMRAMCLRAATACGPVSASGRSSSDWRLPDALGRVPEHIRKHVTRVVDGGEWLRLGRLAPTFGAVCGREAVSVGRARPFRVMVVAVCAAVISRLGSTCSGWLLGQCAKKWESWLARHKSSHIPPDVGLAKRRAMTCANASW